MNKKYGKNLLVISVITLAIFLCGCSTEKEASNSGTVVSEEVAVKSEEMVVTESTSQAASQASVATTPQPTPEATPEPSLEVVVYEGIDMESTLPGKEWIYTFVGIIEEPKLIVYNDETNKKVIVEHQQEFEFGEGDKLAFHMPPKYAVMGCQMEKNIIVEFLISFSYAEVTFDENSPIVEDTITAAVYHNGKRIDDLVYYLKPVE